MVQETIAKAGYFTPLLHVADVEASIRFYELLGFTTVDTDRATPLGWARLHCEGGAVMFLRAGAPVSAATLPVLFYLYAPDLPALRERLLANGINVPPISHPPYMPSGEINISDPDGYHVAVGHWGQTEHEAWLKRIGEKA
jgi:predicted enzyme related to lactoylglutathione lyase